MALDRRSRSGKFQNQQRTHAAPQQTGPTGGFDMSAQNMMQGGGAGSSRINDEKHGPNSKDSAKHDDEQSINDG